MLRERSPSPLAIQNKRQTPPPPPLSTRYTADQMNCSAELEEKKRFLTMFSLSHINTHQRKDNEKVVELLQAIKQKSVTLDSIKHSPRPLCKSPAAPPTVDQTTFHPLSDSEMPPSARPSTPSLPDAQKAMDTSKQEQLRPSEVPRPKEVAAAVPTFPGGDKARLGEGHSVKKNTSLLNSIRAQNAPKEASQSQNGRIKPWESFTAEEFAHQFHESVLQSTQKALQKHKGSAAGQISEPNHKLDSLVHYNIPELQSSVRAPHPQHNGQHNTIAARKELTVVQEEESEEEEETEEEEEEEEGEEAPRPKWQGIEAIFEAYQEYIDEHSIERQVLQSQCRRLEAHHYNLSLTAEQLSHSMGELMSQKQKLASEREKLQAELDHLRKCLAQPQMHWSRGYFKGYPPR